MKTLSVLLLSASLASAFEITLNFDTQLSTVETNAVNNAKSFWESKITGYSRDYGITGPNLYISSGAYSSSVSGYVSTSTGSEGSLPYTAESGIIEIDSASVSSLQTNGSLNNALIRAVGFALGFGNYGTLDSLWNVNNLTSSATAYTGSAAITSFRTEFNQPSATSIGIAGVQEKGWNQTQLANDLFANAPTNLATATLSNTSLSAMKDIGYTVVPEPSSAIFSALTVALCLRKKR